VAIFGEADQYRPFLTQVFQVDSKNPGELEALFQRFFQMYSVSGVPADALEDFAGLCELTRSIMEDVHNTREEGVRFDRAKAYADLLKRTREKKIIIGLDPDPNGIVALAQLAHYWIEGFERNRFEFRFAEELESLIQKSESLRRRLNGTAPPLAKCSECSSIFVATKADQRFCSFRCTDRNGKRRRRAERKSSVLLTKQDATG